MARVAERPVRALELLDAVGPTWLARYSRAAESSWYSAGSVPSKYWLSFFTASAKWLPPGWIAARWIRVIELSRIALRSSGDRDWTAMLLAQVGRPLGRPAEASTRAVNRPFGARDRIRRRVIAAGQQRRVPAPRPPARSRFEEDDSSRESPVLMDDRESFVE